MLSKGLCKDWNIEAYVSHLFIRSWNFCNTDLMKFIYLFIAKKSRVWAILKLKWPIPIFGTKTGTPAKCKEELFWNGPWFQSYVSEWCYRALISSLSPGHKKSIWSFMEISHHYLFQSLIKSGGQICLGQTGTKRKMFIYANLIFFLLNIVQKGFCFHSY